MKYLHTFNESIINRKKNDDIFDYSSIVNSAWNKIIKFGQNFYKTHFDLENNESTGQKKTLYITKNLRVNQPVKYEINAELWTAGGDWEHPVMYFKFEIASQYGLLSGEYEKNPKYIWDLKQEDKKLYKCYVVIPPVEAGNKLVQYENGWRAYTDDDITGNVGKKLKITDEDKKTAWAWFENLITQAIEERHEMLDDKDNNVQGVSDSAEPSEPKSIG
jgi:hypothetical protein